MNPEVFEVVFDANGENQNYAGNKHTILNAKGGDKIIFTTINTDFEVLIHNKDEFFDGGVDIINLPIIKGDPKSLAIKTDIEKYKFKYYTAYSVVNGDYADQPCKSPPKIIIDPK